MDFIEPIGARLRAEWNAKEALDVLARAPQDKPVVIRRLHQRGALWYVLERDQVQLRLVAVGDEDTVETALALSEHDAVVTHDQSEGQRPEVFSGLLLRDDQPFGYMPFEMPVAFGFRDAPDDAPDVGPGTRRAHGFAEAPDSVGLDEEFELRVGLSDTGGRGRAALDLPRGDLDLEVTVTAPPCFVLAEGERWRNTLRVTRDDPYPTCALRLCCSEAGEHTVYVGFAVGGEPVGMATRVVAVDAPATANSGVDAVLTLGDGAPKADLTIEVFSDGDQLTFVLHSRVEAIAKELPSKAPTSTLPAAGPAAFQAQVLAVVPSKPSGLLGYAQMVGIGKQVRRAAPPELWSILRDLGDKVEGTPKVLLLSQEPHIPWELAHLEEPLSDARPPFLGAQVDLGRWVLDPAYPPPPPQHTKPFSDMVVLRGDYEGPYALPKVEEEAEALVDRYGASEEVADEASFCDVLFGGSARMLHFAGHATSVAGDAHGGLLLSDHAPVNHLMLEGASLEQRPFVFLNACEAGSTASALGSYTGIAPAFVRHGCGVVAPLWKVNDTLAKEWTLEFYERVHAGVPVSRALRAMRKRYTRDDDAQAIYMAYVFYGHPALELKTT